MIKFLFRAISLLISSCLILIALANYFGMQQEALTLAYVEQNENGMEALMIVDASNGVRLNLYEARDLHQIAWSPDAQTLAVVDGYAVEPQLILVTLDGEEEILSPAYYNYAMPNFSPDGRFLLYNQDLRSAGVSLNLIDLVTGVHRNLLATYPEYIEWLPDSRHAILRATFWNSQSRFAVLDTTNSRLQYLPVRLNTYERMSPLPDGETFILLAGWQLALLKLNQLDAPETLHHDHATYTQIALAPDGQWFAFISQPAYDYLGAWALSVMDIRSREYRLIVETDGTLRAMAWSADGAWLAYSITPQGASQNYRELYRVRPDGSDSQRIAAGNLATLGFVWRPTSGDE